MRFTPFLLIITCFFSCWADVNGQQGATIGTWTPYVSHKTPTGTTFRRPLMYTTTDGGLFSYNVNTFEEKAYTTTEGLSSTGASAIFYDKAHELIFLGYNDGMINVFEDISEIEYITDIQRSENFTAKNINKFDVNGDVLYVATEFGVVAYDILKRETRASYTKIGPVNTGSKVWTHTILNDTIWVAMGDSGLFFADLNHPNLIDPSAWQVESGNFGLPFDGCELVTNAGGNVYAVVGDTIYRKEGTQWVNAPLPIDQYSYIEGANDIFVATAGSLCQILYPDGMLETANNGGNQLYAYAHDDFVWIGDNSAGLQRYKGGSLSRVAPKGPSNNEVKSVIAHNGEVYISPANSTGSTKSFDKHGFYHYSREEGWTVFDFQGGKLDTSLWLGFTSGHFDRVNNVAYIGSKGYGCYELKDGEITQEYNGYNSGIHGFSPTDLRVTDMGVDSRGNLWVVTMITDANKTVNVKRKSTGEWFTYQVNGSRPIGMVIDDYDNKWLINEKSGITVFSENGTYGNILDDKIKHLGTSVGGGGLPDPSVWAIAKDLNGHMWIGTEDGVTVFFDPFSIFEPNFPDASCPVFEHQCLLKGQRVTAIAVDGANRKWCGTKSGVWLISEDGTEAIHNFTTENSPIFSNEINSIDIDQTTGEVFIGTSRGVISFMGEAIEGNDNCDDLYAFPNPVFSNYDGVITIRGSVAQSAMKIIDVSGKLVRELESLGGQAVWDGRDTWGNRVKSGIYIALSADADGENDCYTKIAFINQQ